MPQSIVAITNKLYMISLTTFIDFGIDRTLSQKYSSKHRAEQKELSKRPTFKPANSPSPIPTFAGLTGGRWTILLRSGTLWNLPCSPQHFKWKKADSPNTFRKSA